MHILGERISFFLQETLCTIRRKVWDYGIEKNVFVHFGGLL